MDMLKKFTQGNGFTIEIKEINELSEIEIQEIVSLLKSGGEVAAAGLENRVKAAKSLVLLKQRGRLSGISALKTPTLGYRRKIEKQTKIDLDPDEYPFELGYIFVLPSSRGKGFSNPLVEAALIEAQNKGVFATCRVDNDRMQKTLSKHGFQKAGNSYPASNKKATIQLLLLQFPKGKPE